MKNLNMSFTRVQGGASYGYMINELLKDNGISKVELAKNWKNDKTVFIINNKKYIIGDSSYIFNYDGQIQLEEFYGKTREINGDTIHSSYANCGTIATLYVDGEY